MATISNGAATSSPQRPPQRNAPRACSICEATFSDAGANTSPDHASATTQSSTSTSRRARGTNNHAPITNMPRIGGLDASFVNIPHYYHRPHATNNNGSMNHLEQNVHDIESILDDALRSSTSTFADNASDGGASVLRKEIVNGADIYDASRRMDKFMEAAMELLSGNSSLQERSLYCQTCLDRIGTALDTCTERLEEECIVYDNAASAEEERTVLLANVLSMSSDANNGVGLDDFHHDDEGAIYRAIDSFQYDIDTLVNACDEQMKELQMLQNLMKDQTDRSIALYNQEDMVHEELNNLEIDARNFGEEAHLVSNSCSAIENEIDKMSRVKLMSIPFKIKVDWEGTSCCGKYPTINNLRLAYRVNDKAGLHRDEINAAFSNAAQLMAFTLGLYPSLITPTIRIIPIHPCAKILVNLPEGQSVHNLGFDTNATSGSTSEDIPNHVPSQSITLFLVLLSELASHIQKSTGGLYSQPPFEMTGFSIDNVDVTKLAESNTSAWSSVVFCVAANLCWLSELQVGQSHV